MDHRQEIITGLGAFAGELDQLPPQLPGGTARQAAVETRVSSPDGFVTVTVRHRQVDRLVVSPELLDQGWAVAVPIVQSTVNAALLEHDEVTMEELAEHSPGFAALAEAARRFQTDMRFQGGGA